MWKTFPEVLGLDNTYKTNRFNMNLFQISGMTDQMSVVPFAYGLSSAEGEGTYDWLLQQLDAFRIQLGVPVPTVVMTDKEEGLRNSVRKVFPGAQ
jgi:hypothetical protein